MHAHWKKYIVEMIGTGLLTYMVLTSLISPFAAFTPVVAGLTLGLFVYTLGGVSGAHINPAVTLGLWSIKKIRTDDAMNYVIFQFLGAVLASGIFRFCFGQPSIEADASFGMLLAEAAGAAVLLFGINAVVHEKAPHYASGMIIGSSLTLGILLASASTNGVLNPAVAVGIGSVSWAYLLGPVLGAIGASAAYRWLIHADQA